jgi:predicted DNA-binding protein (MmcQ/YjbR family)
MNYYELEKCLLSQKGAAKDFPFGSDVAVFKVAGKMFALVAWNDAPLRITLKCDPDEADYFRTMYDAVKPGYYMNKAHWNTITLDGSVPEELLLKMINSSYALVVKGLRKSEREKLL